MTSVAPIIRLVIGYRAQSSISAIHLSQLTDIRFLRMRYASHVLLSQQVSSIMKSSCDPKRNCLAPERTEMLLFIKNNLTLVDGKYAYSVS